MTQRRFHYEQAFEHYLRANAIPYVAVDEAKRALTQAAPSHGAGLKNFDFVVYSQGGENLLVDVKGRKHSGKTGRALQNWVTADDVDCLERWQGIFGDGFVSAFVFMFWCEAQPPDALFHEVFVFNDRWYAVLAVRLADYRKHMRRRSVKWGTVSIPAKAFSDMAEPLKTLL
jgi:hypothetical protein